MVFGWFIGLSKIMYKKIIAKMYLIKICQKADIIITRYLQYFYKVTGISPHAISKISFLLII